jgi:hypothetical protein
LATRIREAGLSVYGFGEKKTPKPFVAACTKFVFTEILRETTDAQSPSSIDYSPLKPILISAITAAAGDDGWAFLGAVGSLISKANPEFDARNYRKKKLGELVKAQDYLEIISQPLAEGATTQQIFVRIKEL